MRVMTQTIMGALGAAFVSLAGLDPAAGQAQGVLLDDNDGELNEPDISEQKHSSQSAQIGIGVRVRQVFIPESILELFIEDVPGGGSHTGVGIELIRQKGNMTLVLGVEYEKLEATEGVWIDRGDSIPEDEPDRIEFNDFGWIGVDISFLWHTEFSRFLALRYGAGLGVGVIRGEVLRTDLRCMTSDPASCVGYPESENNRTPEGDIPPVFPIVNVILGIQLRPTENVAINLEGGLRTVPFAGASVMYLF